MIILPLHEGEREEERRGRGRKKVGVSRATVAKFKSLRSVSFPPTATVSYVS